MKATAMKAKKIKVSESVAAEIGFRLEVAEVGDEDWRLLAQFDGASIVVFDAEHAEALARIACDIANGMDEQAGTGENPESQERTFGTTMRGFWSLSSKLRKLFCGGAQTYANTRLEPLALCAHMR